MASPFTGEIRMFGGTFAPQGYAFCSGQLIGIPQNDVLYSLIGTTYGGDGVNTFALPDLRGRVPIHQGQGNGLQNYTIGQNGGAEQVTLNLNQLPAHNHPALAGPSTSSNQTNPAGNTWSGTSFKQYGTTVNAQMNGAGMGQTGGGQAHDNMLPFVAISFIISLYGTYPTRN